MTDDYEYIACALGADNHAFAGKTVLLTGSQGFLGRLYQEYFRYLNEHVLSERVRVICVDNMIAGQVEGSGNDYVKVDITDRTSLFEAVIGRVQKCDFVINAAGLASPKAYENRPYQTLDVSVRGTINVLEYIRLQGVPSRSLFFSSSEIYGDPDVIPTPESYVGRLKTRTKRSAYDLGKAAIDTLVYNANQQYDLDAQVVMPFNVIGYSGVDGRVLPNMAQQLIRGEKIRVYAPGTQTRTFCWFSDFLEGSIRVLLHGKGDAVNLGNPTNEVSMIDLARRLEKVAGLTDRVEIVGTPVAYTTEPMRRCPDISRARELGYEPKVTLDEALGRFWGWAKENYPKS